MSSYLPMLGVSEKSIPAIDAHSEAMLAHLDTHLKDYPFLLGDRISLADCALMGPLYAHLYLDRVTRQQLYDSAIHVCMWIERCNRPVPGNMTEWFHGDYPESLSKILTLIGDDAVPMLRDQRQAFSDWAANAPRVEAVVPRGVGNYQTSLRNVPVEAGIRPYVSWKVQRLTDAWEQMPHDDQAAVGTMFKHCRCDELLVRSTAPRLKKDRFQLAYA